MLKIKVMSFCIIGKNTFKRLEKNIPTPKNMIFLNVFIF